MRILIKYLSFQLIIYFSLIISVNLKAQLKDTEKVDLIIKTIAPNTFWTNENAFSKYIIGVYGNSSITKELEFKSNIESIKGKPFYVVEFNKMTDIGPVQIIFIPKSKILKFKEIYQVVATNTLVITDGMPNEIEHFSMVNFKVNTDTLKPIRVVPKRAKTAGISFSPGLIQEAGTEEDFRALVLKISEEYKKLKTVLDSQLNELEVLENEAQTFKIENKNEKAEIALQKKINSQQLEEIEKQKIELEEQRENLKKVLKDLAIKQQKLFIYNKILQAQKGKLNITLQLISQSDEQLKNMDSSIMKNKIIIENKNYELTIANKRIQGQRKAMIGFSILFVLILGLLFFIWKGYKIKQKINQELREKNEEINKQKEEIKEQNRKTELLNKELERLSIVAEQTDNAVTIMDKRGNFEWLNISFTRMYGYTLQLLINELDENFINVSTHTDIKTIFKKCISEKKTITYESLNKTRHRKSIWVQTSLTPILNDDGEIIKLITIDTDITQIKEAENEIRKQHKKILEQTVELEATNKELERLSLVASKTDNAISIMDAAGNFNWINEGYSRLFGYTFNQLISEYSGNIITNDMVPEVKTLIKKCIEQQVPVSYQNYRSVRSGNKIWAQTTLTPIKDKEGNPRSIISISQDISKLKHAEQAIRQQSEELMTQKEELILQKEQIEQQNEHIKASITYAKTIQNAILPPQSAINQRFESFIIYKPKDIVSGDFYWYSFIPSKNTGEGKHIIATVDCTGHGVPGAFMSMIGTRLLNEIVKEKKIEQPSEILNQLDHDIKKILRQEENKNSDGMDVCLCSLENSNARTKLVFAGAKRPLFLFRQNEKSLEYIKGTRKTIGGTQAKRNLEMFIDHQFILEKGDVIYMTTDGIIDQPSSERIRFGSLRIINLLNNIGNQPIEVQKNLIESAMLEYQGHEQQRDDVTFVGIKI